MSQPMIPLNYPVTQAEAQVAQFIEGVEPSFYTRDHSVLGTVARALPGESTVELIGE